MTTADSLSTSIHLEFADLRSYKTATYWLDFGFVITLFWACVLCVSLGFISDWFIVPILLTASLALYRASLFSHEISHLSKDKLRGFRLFWDLSCGALLLFPSFMTRSHVDHHSVATYGTAHDPEYLLFADAPKLQSTFFWGSWLVSLMFLYRAMVLVPLAWFSIEKRRLLDQKFSCMAMHSSYQWGSNVRLLSRTDYALEALGSAFAWGVLVACLFGVLNVLSVAFLLACMTLALLVNSWRTLRAHAYRSKGHVMSNAAQVVDSTTFSLVAWLAFLLTPVGQRYHAAHHLFPYLPYHALPEAHRRMLLRKDDWGDIYRQTLR